jgi:hypothetical protein
MAMAWPGGLPRLQGDPAALARAVGDFTTHQHLSLVTSAGFLTREGTLAQAFAAIKGTLVRQKSVARRRG